MGNDNCSGPALAAYLIQWLKRRKRRRYTYRFVFIPETIGAIAYLSTNMDSLKKHVKAGFNLSCVGDDNAYSIVESRYANTLADKVLKNVLKFHSPAYRCYPFLKRGSDERQYSAPGVDLPVVSFCRSKYGEFPEYHTSADDLNYISPSGFQGSFEVISRCILALESNTQYEIKLLCEPQMGRRGLYPTVSQKGSYTDVRARMNFIAYADGTNDLIDISDRIGISCEECIKIAKLLEEEDVIKRIREVRN